MQFFPLKIIQKFDMTDKSCYITLKLTKKYKKQLTYIPGQYIVVQLKDQQGVFQNRSYSLCGNLEDDDYISICIKRFQNGFVSNFICDHLNVEDVLSVSLPEGDFILKNSDALNKGNNVFISAGSGITPIKALIEDLLARSYRGQIYLIYGNNNVNEVIFREFLRSLEKQFNNFTYIPILKETPEVWDGEQGRLIEENIARLFAEYNLPITDSCFFVSGPQGIIDNSKHYLQTLNVPSENIYTEKFFTESPDSVVEDKEVKAVVTCHGESSSIEFKAGQNLLDASLANGINANHSCRVGSCLSCTAQLVSGEIIAQDDSSLTKSHKDNKIILTCQSYAKTSEVELNYDVEVKKSFLQSRNKILILCGALAALFIFWLSLPANEAYFVKGEYNIGHEELECIHCHKDAQGTARQQIQRNFKHLIGAIDQDVAFGKIPVGNNACLQCHDRPNDNHPIYRFEEPKFKDARDAIHPEKCVSCHAEHHHKRVTLQETDYCIHCHKDVEVKNDPLDLKHETLIANEMWNTCIQCHDFHGNHEMKVATKVSDTIPLNDIKAYFNDGKDPYSDVKKYVANLDSINNQK